MSRIHLAGWLIQSWFWRELQERAKQGNPKKRAKFHLAVAGKEVLKWLEGKGWVGFSFGLAALRGVQRQFSCLGEDWMIGADGQGVQDGDWRWEGILRHFLQSTAVGGNMP